MGNHYPPEHLVHMAQFILVNEWMARNFWEASFRTCSSCSGNASMVLKAAIEQLEQCFPVRWRVCKWDAAHIQIKELKPFREPSWTPDCLHRVFLLLNFTCVCLSFEPSHRGALASFAHFMYALEVQPTKAKAAHSGTLQAAALCVFLLATSLYWTLNLEQ